MGSIVMLAPSAFAHHPEITASVDCTGVVSFTSTAWEGFADNPNTPQDEYDLSRSNSGIQISYSSDGGAFQTLGTYAYNKANGYSFSDTLTLSSPLPNQVVLKAQAIAAWGNGVGPGDSRQTGVLTLPTCPRPSGAIGDANCDGHNVTVTLTNSGNGSVDFTISKNGNPLETVTVQGGQTATRSYPLNEDESTDFAVDAPGMNTVTKTVKLDCEQPPPPPNNPPPPPNNPPPPPQNPPSADASASCVEHGAVVTLTNNGDSPLDFTVSKNGTQIDTVTVPAHGSTTKTYPLTEDETAEITINAPGLGPISRTVTLDCEHPQPPVLPNPKASVADADCDEQSVTVTLTNEGLAPVDFGITKNGSPLETVSVAAGQTVTRSYPLTEDEIARIEITAPGLETVTKVVQLDCYDSKASALAACNENGAELTFVNDGKKPAEFTLTLGTDVIDTFTVDAKSTVVRVYPMREDETVTLVVTGTGGYEESFTVTLDCQDVLGERFHNNKPPKVAPDRVQPQRIAPEAVAPQVQGAQLPFTGTKSVDLLLNAFTMIFLGLALMFLSRAKALPAKE
jgi:hypothetical protein